MAAQRAFQAELFAKQHYLKVLSAKSPVAAQRRLSSKPRSTQKTTMEQYNLRSTNHGICSRLTQIYQNNQTSLRRYRTPREQRKSSPDNYQTREIVKDNRYMLDRIISTKSTIGEDWKAREKKLKRYNKLVRKSNVTDHDNLFSVFREMMVEAKAKSKSRRKLKKRERASSAASARAVDQLRQTL